ncbi:replication-relaxation family protein [Robertmurraya sp. FSL R5-0851]|uniref:replication-relaxation family protein n=1 Tax=Robertmurraya sp. FSL R5-0851 TaxID=2921584 RepID=UPI0030FB72E5
MEDTKRIYQFNNKRVWITNKDVDLLHLVWKHRVVSLSQVQFFLRHKYQDKEMAIYQKLLKWHNINIITTEAYTDGNTPYKCVRIAKNGLEILKSEGVVVTPSYNYKNVKIPKHATADHFFGTREVIIRLMLIAEKKGFSTFDSIPPSELPYNNQEEVKAMEQHVTPGAKLTPMVIPDWIVFSEKAILNIESDTGSEFSEAIIEKVKRYVQYVEQGLESIDHHVLIVPPDSKDDDILCYVKSPPKDRSKRVGTLKDYIMRVSAHLVPNLHFHVVSSSRSGKVAYDILSGNYMNHSELATKIVDAFRVNRSLADEVVEVEPGEIYPPNIEQAMYADKQLIIKKKEGTSKLVLVKVMDEGSVKSLDELSFLNYVVENNLLGREIDEVLAVYATDDELYTDTLGERWNLKKILFTSLQQLNKNGKSGAAFYRSTKPLKKSRCSLYEG